MKKKDLKDLRAKKVAELEKMLSEKKLAVIKTQTDMSGGKEKNFKKGSNLKREVAQIMTIKSEMRIIEKEAKTK